MRVVFFGSGGFAVPSLRWLANSPHEVVLVVTQPDRPAGRTRQLQPTPVAVQAGEEGFAVERCEDVNAEAFVARVRGLGADLGIVIDFGQKLRGLLRSAFPSECVNLHGSLLPKYRGASPIAAAILNGEPRTGVTVFRLVDRMDAGPILVQRETMIAPEETAEELHARLSRVGCDAIDAALKLHEGETLPPGTPQNDSAATLAPKLKKSDGHLRFDEPADAIERRIRAMYPWPGGRCRYVPAEGEGVELTIVQATVVPREAGAPPGTITERLTVAAASGSLELQAVQPAGKRVMSWQDFVNGRRVRAGDRLEPLRESEK